MKRFIFIFSLTLFSFQADETAAVDRLLQTTQRQLIQQTELKELIIEFKSQQEAFLQGDSSKEHATQMVHTAAEILKIIKENNYDHLFSPMFLQELQLFTSIATKKNLGKP